MYVREHIAHFCERRHQRQANRLIAILPMIDSRALELAHRQFIEAHGEPEEVAD